MSRRGHLPVRMCIGCRARRKKSEMIRFVRVLEGGQTKLVRGQGGKGVYLCPEISCLKAAQKRLALKRIEGQEQIQTLSNPTV
ncbi:MAG: DUF448 domain-containing protein [Desulfobacterota bacterium]|nr:DUF448 domain-containing protein [Thermodesulfobacteriota bacterium]